MEKTAIGNVPERARENVAEGVDYAGAAAGEEGGGGDIGGGGGGWVGEGMRGGWGGWVAGCFGAWGNACVVLGYGGDYVVGDLGCGDAYRRGIGVWGGPGDFVIIFRFRDDRNASGWFSSRGVAAPMIVVGKRGCR